MLVSYSPPRSRGNGQNLSQHLIEALEPIHFGPLIIFFHGDSVRFEYGETRMQQTRKKRTALIREVAKESED